MIWMWVSKPSLPQGASAGVEDVCAEIQDHIASARTYVSFDIDVLDPAFAPVQARLYLVVWPAGRRCHWSVLLAGWIWLGLIWLRSARPLIMQR